MGHKNRFSAGIEYPAKVKKWGRIAIAVVAIAVVAIAVVAAALELYRTREPRYNGRPVTAWIRESWDKGDEQMGMANEAVQACGTAAIPYHLKLLQTKPDTPLKVKFLDFLERHNWPTWGLSRDVDQRNRALGGTGLVLLGLRARPAFPTLIQLAFGGSDQDSTEPGYVLTSIGTEGVGVLTNILGNPKAKKRWLAAQLAGNYAMDNWLKQPRPPEETEFAAQALEPYLVAGLGDADRGVKICSIESLARLRRAPEAVVPSVIRILQTETNGWEMRTTLMNALSQYGTKARDAIPALLIVLNDPDESNCRQAGSLLVRIDRSTIPAVVKRFTEVFQDPTRTKDDRNSMIYFLEFLGEEARAAAPALLELSQHDKRFTQIAAAALLSIDSKLAVQAGVDFMAIFSTRMGGNQTAMLAAIKFLDKSEAPAKERVPPLLKALENYHPEISHEAGLVLKKIAPEEAVKAGGE